MDIHHVVIREEFPMLDLCSILLYIMFALIYHRMIIPRIITKSNNHLRYCLYILNASHLLYLAPQLPPKAYFIPWQFINDALNCTKFYQLCINLLYISHLVCWLYLAWRIHYESVSSISQNMSSKLMKSTIVYWLCIYCVVLWNIEGGIKIFSENTHHCYNAFNTSLLSTTHCNWGYLLFLNIVYHRQQQYKRAVTKYISCLCLVLECANILAMAHVYNWYRSELIPCCGYSVRCVIYALLYWILDQDGMNEMAHRWPWSNPSSSSADSSDSDDDRRSLSSSDSTRFSHATSEQHCVIAVVAE